MQDAQIVEQSKPTLTTGSVFAVWLQNFGGGLGAAVLAGVLAWQVGADGWAVARWAALAGALVFGALMVLRSAVDEIIDIADYRRLIGDLEATRTANADLRDTVAALQRDLIAANAYLTVTDHSGTRQVLRNTPSATAAPEVRDAQELIRRHFSDGKWPAKDRMNRLLGWPSPRWFAARDVLAAHGIVAKEGRSTVVLVASLQEALTKLEGPKS
jgi:hypothetical protein